MAKKQKKAPSQKEELFHFDPHVLMGSNLQTLPLFHTEWKKVGDKRRLISTPNKAMRRVHAVFERHLHEAINLIGEVYGTGETYTLRKLPSSTGSVPSSNHFVNAEKHKGHRFFYITDFVHAYPSVDLDRLTKLLVLIFHYGKYQLDSGYSLRWFASNPLAQEMMTTDKLYLPLREFVRIAFSGPNNIGLAIGGPMSPRLLNLYCEVFLDSKLRALCERKGSKENTERTITYTRYVDDLVFSRDIIIGSDLRREIRSLINDAGFSVNHRKSRVLDVKHGTVFVTKVGIENTGDKAVLRFPRWKRDRIEGVMKSYLATPAWNDSPEVIRGMIAEFLHYLRLVTPTETDKRTLNFCKEFKHASHEYRKRYKNRHKPLRR
ncbi:MAG: RNA-directed polymerase [Patescibacteria group bacterium]|nr:RNA-directed polymerase [Patescibacteria group bacterium]